jgi:RecB family exonuclease
MTTLIIEHTLGANGATAEALSLADIPAELHVRVYQAALLVSYHYGDLRINAIESDKEADEALAELSRLIENAMRQHAKPTVVDHAFVAAIRGHGGPPGTGAAH